MDMITRGVDYIYHAAALKQVPSCEFHPMEAVATNVLGTVERHRRRDKEQRQPGGLPFYRQGGLSGQRHGHVQGADGESGGRARRASSTAAGRFSPTTRYGNVLGSRGSVLPLSCSRSARASRSPITDPAMTRFVMTLNEAVDLCLYAFELWRERRHVRPEGAGVPDGRFCAGRALVMDRPATRSG